jgi:Ca2+-transporting ATPase
MVAYTKGAPEIILDACTQFMIAEGERPLNAAEREHILATARTMAGDALRVLAVARKQVSDIAEAARALTFVGLGGMIDPPRQEARAAIATCAQAGIRPIMITGDHPVTAQAVAREIGLLTDGRVVTGAELEELSEADLAREVEHIAVYARVSPAHKLRVVTALQQRGHVVAMTGDSVKMRLRSRKPTPAWRWASPGRT